MMTPAQVITTVLLCVLCGLPIGLLVLGALFAPILSSIRTQQLEALGLIDETPMERKEKSDRE